MMRSILVSVFLVCSGFVVPVMAPSLAGGTLAHSPSDGDECAVLYASMQLDGIVNYTAFRQAVEGYRKIGNRHRDILTLIDFSKPSTEKRLYVFDMEKRKMLYNSLVSHGRNSGGNYATSFSNEYGSCKSSLGFYLTETTYNGSNGYSLILNGLEKGINDKAKERAIVVHGASYANPSVIKGGGRLGRSLGCPALPENISRPVIDAIKGGSVMYIYAGKPEYFARSEILSGNLEPSADESYLVREVERMR